MKKSISIVMRVFLRLERVFRHIALSIMKSDFISHWATKHLQRFIEVLQYLYCKRYWRMIRLGTKPSRAIEGLARLGVQSRTMCAKCIPYPVWMGQRLTKTKEKSV